ncbi:regulatory Fis family protein [Novosphingobium sp. PhB165]|uniref:helix-turn-helix domain-containing protein n=1 Tax=Novosphingobium sp. PhB165 TaxID=2485105 RepID=UPI001048B539|nr:helix-turn-helix domain-containing protein [Novosphingobium sp. PhB165]TCM17746.1 regulatory Fis family protein [Novosphingobium sp. PhB165]
MIPSGKSDAVVDPGPEPGTELSAEAPPADATRLMLVGELGTAMGLAVEMVRGSAASIAVGTAGGAIRETWRCGGDVAVIEFAVDLPDVMARLRGERPGKLVFRRAVSGLVGHSIDHVERELILQTLERCAGNRTSAASMLGISVRTMRNKLRTFLADGQVLPPGLVRH